MMLRKFKNIFLIGALINSKILTTPRKKHTIQKKLFVWAFSGIEPLTTRTLSEYYTTKPKGLLTCYLIQLHFGKQISLKSTEVNSKPQHVCAAGNHSSRKSTCDPGLINNINRSTVKRLALELLEVHPNRYNVQKMN